jgi:hypothetical protein
MRKFVSLSIRRTPRRRTVVPRALPIPELPTAIF